MLMIVSLTSFAQDPTIMNNRKIYEVILESSMKEYEPVFYADMYFSSNTMIINATSKFDMQTKAKELWLTMWNEWDYETRKLICEQTQIKYFQVVIDDKYHHYSFKDKMISPTKISY